MADVFWQRVQGKIYKACLGQRAWHVERETLETWKTLMFPEQAGRKRRKAGETMQTSLRGIPKWCFWQLKREGPAGVEEMSF